MSTTPDSIDPAFKDYITIEQDDKLAAISDGLIKTFNPEVKYADDVGVWTYPLGLGNWAINKLPKGDEYNWHIDAMHLVNQYPNFYLEQVYWVRIKYLSYGAPLLFGNFNCLAKEVVTQNHSTVPLPNKIIGTVYPCPGKTIKYPSYMIHGVFNNQVDRWTLITFDKDYIENDYVLRYKTYFNLF